MDACIIVVVGGLIYIFGLLYVEEKYKRTTLKKFWVGVFASLWPIIIVLISLYILLIFLFRIFFDTKDLEEKIENIFYEI